MLHSVDEVHPVDAGDERGEHEDDAQRGHSLHRVAHVVVDDGRVGVDGRLQDVGVDVGGFACLTHLNVYVFNHVGIEFVDVQLKFQLGEQHFVATDGGGKIGERVLQAREIDEVGIVDGAIQISFGGINNGADLFQTLEIPDCAREEKAKDEIDRVGET